MKLSRFIQYIYSRSVFQPPYRLSPLPDTKSNSLAFLLQFSHTKLFVTIAQQIIHYSIHCKSTFYQYLFIFFIVLTLINIKNIAIGEFRYNFETSNKTNSSKPTIKFTTMASVKFQSNLMNLQANLLNFAYMLTSNRDDAYDLLQDTTLKALDNEEKYSEGTNFKGWVFTIMRNIFINNYRRGVRSATVVDTTDNLYHLNLSQDSGIDSPEDSYAANEISDAINEFSDEYRIPFSMHVAGYKYNEIADHMGLPLGTVKSRIFMARKRLQERFADYR